MDSREFKELEGFVERIIREAGKVTLTYFQSAFQTEIKEDGSPVTTADRKSEETLRRLIAQQFPSHGILGEEFGETNPGAEYRWILDPIDGTKPFVAGVPQYTVLVALEHQQDGVVGAIYNPALDRLTLASRGNGCNLNGKRVSVGTKEDLEQATVLSSDYGSLIRRCPESLTALLSRCWHAPGWGDAYGYTLVVEGRSDVMLDSGLKIWDAAPLKVIVEEAGGIFSGWNGERSIYVTDGVAANPVLHQKILPFLKEKKES